MKPIMVAITCILFLFGAIGYANALPITHYFTLKIENIAGLPAFGLNNGSEINGVITLEKDSFSSEGWVTTLPCSVEGFGTYGIIKYYFGSPLTGVFKDSYSYGPKSAQWGTNPDVPPIRINLFSDDAAEALFCDFDKTFTMYYQ